MNRFIFLLIALVIGGSLFAQHRFEGAVYDSKTNEKLPYVNLIWLNTKKGTSTDSLGNFSINLNPKIKKLVVSYIGYHSDTLLVDKPMANVKVFLNENSTMLRAVSINERKQSSFYSKMSVEQKEVISSEGLKHLACCNLGESFENTASVDVGYSDAVSGSKQIQLLGLTGVYSQLLLENMPFLRGLSAPFGLGYVPGSWMESISISKGVANVVHGYETVTGQINLEYDKPMEADPLFLNLYVNSELKGELNAKANFKINERLYTGMLLHSSLNWQEIDHLGKDGFMDYPRQSQFNFVNRWQYEGSKFHSHTLVNYLHERRTGGQMGFKHNMRGDTSLYGLGGDVDRLHFFTKNGWMVGHSGSIGTQITGTYFRNDQFFGLNNYLGEQSDLYGNFIFANETPHAHQYTVGLSMRYTNLREDYIANGNGTFFNSSNSLYLYKDAFFKEEIVPGAFGQFSFIYGDRFTTTAGLRYDYNSHFEEHLITPRLHFRWKIMEDLILRGAAGKGYRSANVIADNFGILASSRQIVIKEDLMMEDAFNGGLNIYKSFKTKDEREFSITMDYYYTKFINQVIMDLEQDPRQAIFYNLDGKSYSNSFQMDIMLEPIKRFTVTLAGRYNDVKTTFGGVLMEKPYVSKLKGLVVLSYKTKYDKWMFDLTTQFNGQQRIPNNIGEKQGYSDPYIFMLGQVTRKFKNFDVYVGCENITNYTQETPVIGADRPFSNMFDASVVYAPVMGRLFYAGLRLTIK
ncbi:MAG: TonB-dependent receptor [Bacteroidales bacterium]|nr:TonB-dependent receptor [Bacteroidales bacterium]MDD4703466.1 TonB-dependent receptor [Bacteroidales bacterium]MDX9798567.1 TonB-dependent receptor [Bacteroidales bacterium]